MARKVTSMRVIAAVTAFVAGEPVNVSKVCREAGVTRKTFYKWAARYRDGGLPSLEERSRRPLSSPARTPGWVEEAIVALREELALAGLDHGALTLQWHLEQRRTLAAGSRPLRWRGPCAAVWSSRNRGNDRRGRGGGSKPPRRTSTGRSMRWTGLSPAGR